MALNTETFGEPSKARAPAQDANLAKRIFLFSLPFMFWPKLLDGDIQLWILMSASLCAVFYWPQNEITKPYRVSITIFLATCCFLSYYFRESDPDLTFRYFGILAGFVVLWVAISRCRAIDLDAAVRFTIIIWFFVGIAQFVLIKLGFQIELFGRHDASRSGVTSLTAEPSYYGSISAIQLMYILSTWKGKRIDFLLLIMCFISIVISGSILSYIFLLIPLSRLPIKYMLTGFIGLMFVVYLNIDLYNLSVFKRIANFRELFLNGTFLDSLLADASANLRVGHIIFTLYENLWQSLFFQSPISFQYSYNSWAITNYNYLQNESEFILPVAGELIFRSGIFGLLLVGWLYFQGLKGVKTTRDKLEKVAFLSLCFINPVSLANPFFIIYILRDSKNLVASQ